MLLLLMGSGSENLLMGQVKFLLPPPANFRPTPASGFTLLFKKTYKNDSALLYTIHFTLRHTLLLSFKTPLLLSSPIRIIIYLLILIYLYLKLSNSSFILMHCCINFFCFSLEILIRFTYSQSILTLRIANL